MAQLSNSGLAVILELEFESRDQLMSHPGDCYGLQIKDQSTHDGSWRKLSGQSTLILFIRWASTQAPFHKDSRFDRSRNRHEKQHHSASESCNAKEWLAERKVLLADEKNLRNTAIV